MHKLPESKHGTVQDRKKDDSDTAQSLISDPLRVDGDVENDFRLGTFSGEQQRTRPVRFTVDDMGGKRKMLDASKNQKNGDGYSNIYFTQNLARNQRQTVFKLRDYRICCFVAIRPK